jgi:Gas vesicle synthesis protein GvpO
MAEESTRTRRRSRSQDEDGAAPREDDEERKERKDDSGGDRRLPARELTRAAMETVEDLTGYPAESVSGLQWDGESWLVTVDVLELERVPSPTDVLATYVVQLDDGGNLLGYKRTRRFLRAEIQEE